MITLIALYLAFGLGFYIGLALKDVHSFEDATPMSIMRGIALGLILWPVGLILMAIYAILQSRQEPLEEIADLMCTELELRGLSTKLTKRYRERAK